MKINTKLELLKACIFISIGAYLCIKFMPKPKPQEPKTVFVEQKQKCEVVVKKVTKPDGSIEESVSASASSDQKTEITPPQTKVQAQYAIALSGLKRIDYVSPSARLGGLPLWVGADVSLKDLKDSKLQLRMEF